MASFWSIALTGRGFRLGPPAKQHNAFTKIQTRFEAGLNLFKSGNFEDAKLFFEKVLKIDPKHVGALHLLGLIFYQQGDYERSVAQISRVIKIDPKIPEAYSNLGLALQGLDRFDEALASCNKAIELRPSYTEAFNNRGNALKCLKRLGEALASYDKAIELKKDNADAFNNRGAILNDLRRFEEAVASCNKAIELSPKYAEAFINLGNALRGLKKYSEALASYDKAIEFKPHANAYINRGIALSDLERFEEAVISFNKAIELKPDYAEGFKSLGKALNDLKRFDEAVASFDKAIELKPDDFDAYNNRGVAQGECRRFDDAVASFKKAIELKPNYAGAFNNLGKSLTNLKRFDEAMSSYDRAIELNPNDGDFRFNKAHCELLNGRMETGWLSHEYRKEKRKPVGNRFFSQPLWLGDRPLENKTILVHWEQGLGDTIQFCRYLKDLTGATVLFAPQMSLGKLLQGLSPSIKVVDADDKSLRFDFHCPLLSLPLAFYTTLETIPRDIPYLFADPERIRAWGEKLGSHGFRVGINWQGSRSEIDVGRSFALAEFSSLAQIQNVRLISLHKGEGVDQLDNLPDGMKVETLGQDFDAGPDAFLDTAAVMKCCDLVISSDTATAHLAGALGVPVWVALKWVPDWRWMLDREDSPWYPTMRLFRQKTDGDWKGVFQEIERELVKVIGSTASLEITKKQVATAASSLTTPVVSVSWGELIDKITILETKNARLSSDEALANVRKELEILREKASPVFEADQNIRELKQQLTMVNEALWEIEDNIRKKEAEKEFDATFVELARSVYIKNDERARIKREINNLLASELVEEKSYKKYLVGLGQADTNGELSNGLSFSGIQAPDIGRNTSSLQQVVSDVNQRISGKLLDLDQKTSGIDARVVDLDVKMRQISRDFKNLNQQLYDVKNALDISTTPKLLRNSYSNVKTLPNKDYQPIFNPSVCEKGGLLMFCSRRSNFLVKMDGRAILATGEAHNTINVIHYLSKELEVISEAILDDTLLRKNCELASNGIEDIRLFTWKGQIYGIGAGISFNEERYVVTQILIRIDDNTVSEYFVLASPVGASQEKNWMPLVIGDELFFVYSLLPLVIYRFNEGALDLFKGEAPSRNEFSIRGGTPIIKINSKFVGIAHLAPLKFQQKNYYRHLFVVLDQFLEPDGLSEPFFIQRKGIEFACGLHLLGDDLLISYGVSDGSANFCMLPQSNLLEFIVI